LADDDEGPMTELHSVTIEATDMGVVTNVFLDGVPVLVSGEEPITVTTGRDGVMIVNLPFICKAFNTVAPGEQTPLKGDE
jgi:hypothetical protein